MGTVSPYRIPAPPVKVPEPKLSFLQIASVHWKRWALRARTKYIRSEFWWLVGFTFMTLYPMAASLAYTLVSAEYFYQGRWSLGTLYIIIVLGYVTMTCWCAVVVKRIATGQK